MECQEFLGLQEKMVHMETEVLLGPRVSKANKGYKVLLVPGDQMDLKGQKGIQEHQDSQAILESKGLRG